MSENLLFQLYQVNCCIQDLEMSVIKLLTYNVSYFGINGVRRGKFHQANGQIRSEFPSKHELPLPGSKAYESDLPLRNICQYFSTLGNSYDIITIIEGDFRLIKAIQPNIAEDYQIVRVYTTGVSESIYLLVNKKLQIKQAFCLSMKTTEGLEKSRPIGILVFDKFIYVAVHLPHAKKPIHLEEPIILELLLSGLNRVFGGQISKLPIIIGGDFNTEQSFSFQQFQNTNPDVKTAFTLVPDQYFKKGERPLQLAYDHFTYNRDLIKVIDVSAPLDIDHLQGNFSDHLPLTGIFQINSELLSDLNLVMVAASLSSLNRHYQLDIYTDGILVMDRVGDKYHQLS